MTNSNKKNSAAKTVVVDGIEGKLLEGNNANGTNLKQVIDADIVEIAKSETITKTLLSRLSRNLLHYVPESKDIGAVNRLLSALTRNNAKVAVLYFTHFLPWKFSADVGKFGQMLNSKAEIAKRLTALNEWLATEANDIWLWAEREVNIEPKDKNYKAQIASLVTRAMTANGANEKFKISAKDVLTAVITGGVDIKDIMALVNVMAAPVTDEEPDAQVVPVADKADDNQPTVN